MLNSYILHLDHYLGIMTLDFKMQLLIIIIYFGSIFAFIYFLIKMFST